MDIKKINARCAYTLDGEGEGELENETFSADLATVTITGYNIHPGLATGKMINSIRLAGQFLERIPWYTMAPETTCGKVGFMHPYVIEGGVPEVKIRILLRSFVTAELKEEAKILKNVANTLMAEFPRAKVTVKVQKQYRNMLEHLKKEPRAVKLAAEAIKKATGNEAKWASIRGGTDGSRLSEMGLPTPNLAVGMHNFHSELEFALPGADGKRGEDPGRTGPALGEAEVVSTRTSVAPEGRRLVATGGVRRRRTEPVDMIVSQAHTALKGRRDGSRRRHSLTRVPRPIWGRTCLAFIWSECMVYRPPPVADVEVRWSLDFRRPTQGSAATR